MGANLSHDPTSGCPSPTAGAHPACEVRVLAAGEFDPRDIGLDDLDGLNEGTLAYEASSLCFPGQVWLAATPDSARRGLAMLVRELVELGEEPSCARPSETAAAEGDDVLF